MKTFKTHKTELYEARITDCTSRGQSPVNTPLYVGLF